MGSVHQASRARRWKRCRSGRLTLVTVRDLRSDVKLQRVTIVSW